MQLQTFPPKWLPEPESDFGVLAIDSLVQKFMNVYRVGRYAAHVLLEQQSDI